MELPTQAELERFFGGGGTRAMRARVQRWLDADARAAAIAVLPQPRAQRAPVEPPPDVINPRPQRPHGNVDVVFTNEEVARFLNRRPNRALTAREEAIRRFLEDGVMPRPRAPPHEDVIIPELPHLEAPAPHPIRPPRMAAFEAAMNAFFARYRGQPEEEQREELRGMDERQLYGLAAHWRAELEQEIRESNADLHAVLHEQREAALRMGDAEPVYQRVGGRAVRLYRAMPPLGPITANRLRLIRLIQRYTGLVPEPGLAHFTHFVRNERDLLQMDDEELQEHLAEILDRHMNGPPPFGRHREAPRAIMRLAQHMGAAPWEDEIMDRVRALQIQVHLIQPHLNLREPLQLLQDGGLRAVIEEEQALNNILENRRINRNILQNAAAPTWEYEDVPGGNHGLVGGRARSILYNIIPLHDRNARILAGTQLPFNPEGRNLYFEEGLAHVVHRAALRLQEVIWGALPAGERNGQNLRRIMAQTRVQLHASAAGIVVYGEDNTVPRRRALPELGWQPFTHFTTLRQARAWVRDEYMPALRAFVDQLPSAGVFYITNLWASFFPHREIAPAGGCYKSSAERVSAMNGVIAIAARSTGNNCLFWCIRRTFPELDFDARSVRGVLRLAPSTRLTVADAMEVANALEIPLRVRDAHRDLRITENDLAADALARNGKTCDVLLADHHYFLVKSIDRQVKECGACGRHYYGMHRCNPERAAYYARVVRGREAGEPKYLKVTRAADVKVTLKRRIFFFDLETFGHAAERRHEVYCAAWMMLEDERPERSFGPDSFNEMFAILVDAREDYMICAYNGSGFDFHFLLKECIKRGLAVSDICFHGGKFLRFTMTMPSGMAHTVWDINCFLHSTLKKACKSYGISVSKGIFPHRYLNNWEQVMNRMPQTAPNADWYDRSVDEDTEELERLPEQWYNEEGAALEDRPWTVYDAVYPYVGDDVIAMKELFVKLDTEFRAIFDEVDITQFLTLPQLSMHLWQRTLGATLIERPTEPEVYIFIREALFGGRTNLGKRVFDAREHGEHMEVYDFNSEYPAQMHKQQFPIGPSRWLPQADIDCLNHLMAHKNIPLWNEAWPPFAIAQYVAKPPRYLEQPVLPHRRPDGGLAWDLWPHKGHATLVELKLAARVGYEIVIVKARVWDKGEHIFRDTIEHYMKIKNEGGKKVDGKMVNPAKRAIGKNLANDLFGKQAQNVHTGSHVIATEHIDILKFLEDYVVSDVMDLPSGQLLMSGSRADLDAIEQTAKAPQLGCYITAYARCALWEAMALCSPYLNTPHLVAEHGEAAMASLLANQAIYYDTDSLMVPASVGRALHEAGMVGDELGQLKREYDGKVTLGIFLAPKFYRLIVELDNGKIKEINKIKGIPTKAIPKDVYDQILARPSETKEVSFEHLESVAFAALSRPGDDADDLFNIHTRAMKRTINKTPYTKRHVLENGVDTLPWGFFPDDPAPVEEEIVEEN